MLTIKHLHRKGDVKYVKGHYAAVKYLYNEKKQENTFSKEKVKKVIIFALCAEVLAYY